MAGFPNLFMLYGPNTNLGHNSIIFMIECQVGYAVQCMRELAKRGATWLDVRRDVMDHYNRELQTALAQDRLDRRLLELVQDRLRQGHQQLVRLHRRLLASNAPPRLGCVPRGGASSDVDGVRPAVACGVLHTLTRALGSLVLAAAAGALLLAGAGAWRIARYAQVDDVAALARKAGELAWMAEAARADASSPRPNVVLILFDDLGLGDLGVTGGHALATPRLDALGAEGMVLEQYSAPAPVLRPRAPGSSPGAGRSARP